MNNITLRAVEPQDVDIIYRLENDSEISNVSFGEAAISRQLIWEYVNQYTADIYRDRQLRLMIEADGRTVGTLDLSDFDPKNLRAFVGIAIDADYRGNGIGPKALQQAIDYARMRLGLHQLIAVVPKDNTPSLKIFADLKFKTSGCLRSWLRRGNAYVDAVIMQLML